MPESAVASPPPASAPATPAPTAPVGIPEPAGSEAFADLESLAVEKETGSPESAPEAKPEAKTADRPRAQDGKFTKDTPKTEPKPEVKAEPKPEVKSEPEHSKMAPKQLREAYEALQAKHKALEAEHTSLKSKPAEDPERKALSEKLTAREQRLQELEDEMRFLDYSKSDEYKQRFEKPFTDAYMSARAKVANMKVVQRQDDVGEVTQQGRDATATDFDNLMRIQNDEAAAEYAEKMFGSKAPMVLFHRERVLELNSARESALEDFRKQGGEREKTRAEAHAKEVQEFTGAIDKHYEQAAQKYPKWFAPDDADPEGNEALERGQHLVARVAANGAPLKEGERPMTKAEFAAAIASVRHKAGAFDRLARRHASASKRIAELETELAQYKSSNPGTSDGKGVVPQGDDESLESALGMMEKKYSSAG